MDQGGLKQVYELKVADVLVTRTEDFAAGGYGIDFSFGQLLIQTKAAAAATWSAIAEYNFDDNKVGYADRGITAGKATATATGVEDFVISFDGVSGESHRAGYRGWFELEGIAFGAASTVDRNGATLVSTGTIFDRISVDVLSAAALSDFLAQAASGEAFKGATLRGLGGNDSYYLDSFFDSVFENAAEGDSDTVYTTATFDSTNAGEIENIIAIYTDTNGIVLVGNGINNSITGAAGDDFLYGFGGSDTLNGGTGFDEMDGGAGDDSLHVDSINDQTLEAVGEGTDFVYASASYALFGGNELEVSTAHFGIANAPLSGVQFVANLTGQAIDGGNFSTRFIYDTDDARLYFDLDGTAAGARVEIASFNIAPALTISDFSLLA